MKRILFIEDDYITVEPLIAFLEIQGHAVKHVDNLADAIATLMWDAFDYIFLDVMLPPGDIFTLEETADGRYTGLLFLELIKTSPDFRINIDARVTLITNWRDEPQVDSYASKHHTEVLRKPLSLADVEGVVQ